MVEPKTKILVVEDELPIRSFLRTTLGPTGSPSSRRGRRARRPGSPRRTIPTCC